MKIYKQIMNVPENVASILNELQKDGKEIAYVLPCHEYDGTLVVIVYTEEVEE